MYHKTNITKARLSLIKHIIRHTPHPPPYKYVKLYLDNLGSHNLPNLEVFVTHIYINS